MKTRVQRGQRLFTAAPRCPQQSLFHSCHERESPEELAEAQVLIQFALLASAPGISTWTPGSDRHGAGAQGETCLQNLIWSKLLLEVQTGFHGLTLSPREPSLGLNQNPHLISDWQPLGFALRPLWSMTARGPFTRDRKTGALVQAMTLSGLARMEAGICFCCHSSAQSPLPGKAPEFENSQKASNTKPSKATQRKAARDREDQASTPPTPTPKSPENDSKILKTGLFFSWSHNLHQLEMFHLLRSAPPRAHFGADRVVDFRTAGGDSFHSDLPAFLLCSLPSTLGRKNAAERLAVMGGSRAASECPGLQRPTHLPKQARPVPSGTRGRRPVGAEWLGVCGSRAGEAVPQVGSPRSAEPGEAGGADVRGGPAPEPGCLRAGSNARALGRLRGDSGAAGPAGTESGSTVDVVVSCAVSTRCVNLLCAPAGTGARTRGSCSCLCTEGVFPLPGPLGVRQVTRSPGPAPAPGSDAPRALRRRGPPERLGTHGVGASCRPARGGRGRGNEPHSGARGPPPPPPPSRLTWARAPPAGREGATRGRARLSPGAGGRRLIPGIPRAPALASASEPARRAPPAGARCRGAGASAPARRRPPSAPGPTRPAVPPPCLPSSGPGRPEAGAPRAARREAGLRGAHGWADSEWDGSVLREGWGGLFLPRNLRLPVGTEAPGLPEGECPGSLRRRAGVLPPLGPGRRQRTAVERDRGRGPRTGRWDRGGGSSSFYQQLFAPLKRTISRPFKERLGVTASRLY
ncbi:hypothetical protein Cadr_000020692 [Camelus dromedarius]|uniref:Uncharacterized protein n=1 Tax=Camelus dromedarius TaxID=9838 RepID=A0A5N4CYC7_CAMDR|nr:hypothetical protein Cadr_000020692 [Camelus dromedarius]